MSPKEGAQPERRLFWVTRPKLRMGEHFGLKTDAFVLILVDFLNPFRFISVKSSLVIGVDSVTSEQSDTLPGLSSEWTLGADAASNAVSKLLPSEKKLNS